MTKKISKNNNAYDTKTIGLEKNSFRRPTRWMVDSVEYLDAFKEELKLSTISSKRRRELEEALEFMAKFQNEYYQGLTIKELPESIHQSNDHRLQIGRDLLRNRRDVSSLLGATRQLKSLDAIEDPYNFDDEK